MGKEGKGKRERIEKHGRGGKERKKSRVRLRDAGRVLLGTIR